MAFSVHGAHMGGGWVGMGQVRTCWKHVAQEVACTGRPPGAASSTRCMARQDAREITARTPAVSFAI